MKFCLVPVLFMSSLFGHTNGLLTALRHNATQPQLGSVVKVQEDCYTPYDRKPFVKLTPCTQAMVDQMNRIIESYSSGCIDASHQGVLRMPRKGCANGAVICPYATAEELKLKFGSYANIVVHDAGAQLRSTSVMRPSAMGVAPFRDFYSKYASSKEQVKYVEDLIAKSNGYARAEQVGVTTEGRPIHVIKISGPNYTEGSGRKLFTTFQLHAREWISGMAGVFAIENVIENLVDDPNYLGPMQIMIMPNCNPDGFEYSQNHMRLWRKNRRVATDGGCEGVDLNRNFPKDWGGMGSTSNSSCSEVYTGPSALSEPESIAISKVMDEHVQVHLDFHSYSEMILRPWSYTAKEHPQVASINALGQQLYQAVQGARQNIPTGWDVNYQYGGPDMLYEASGVLPDYTTDRGAFGYTVELSPGPNIMNGFELGPEHIKHVSREAYAIIDASLTYIRRGGVVQKVPAPPLERKFRKIARNMLPVQ